MQGDRALAPEALLGAVLDKRFRLVQHLASGGVGFVYLAEDARARGRVKPCFAVKVLRPEHARSELLLARFAREIEAARRVADPHVLAIHHHGRLADGLPYFVAELLEGLDLADTLALSRALSPPRAVAFAIDAARGLAAAHAAGVVHRDLKPENVFLVHDADGRERVKLLDFGFAWIADDPGEVHSGRLSLHHAPVGTPEYMSPEQALGDIGRPSSDIYALGVVLFEMLAGTPPFTGSRMELLHQHARVEPPSLAHVSKELERVVHRALEKDPSNRYESALAMAEALRNMPEMRGRPR